MRGRVIRWTLPLVALGVIGVGAAMASTMHSSGGTVQGKSGKYGVVLVNSKGMTLYRFTPDSKGVNTCSKIAACNKAWPRFTVKAGAKPSVGSGASSGLVGTLKQAKGVTQVTYAGYPLYLFSGDKKAGDMNGQGIGGTWYVVNTKGALVKKAVVDPSTSTSTSTTSTSSGSKGGYGY